MKTKECKLCKEVKSLEEFHKHERTKDGRQGHCKACHYAKTVKWRKQNKEQHTYNMRCRTLAKYGLTVEEYDAILAQQDCKCAICGMSDEEHGKSLVVDHNHVTGEVRGLLCRNCNVGIGALGDDVQRIINAAAYLKERGSYATKGEYHDGDI